MVQAIGHRRDLVLVAQSFGGFAAPLVCERVPVNLMVLLAAMIPSPGEAPNDYWTNTGWQPAKVASVEQPEGMSTQDADTIATFYHDLAPVLATEALQRGRGQPETPGEEPWPLEAWPDVPTRFLLCRDDRLFPAEWLRRVVKERLGITPTRSMGVTALLSADPERRVHHCPGPRP